MHSPLASVWACAASSALFAVACSRTPARPSSGIASVVDAAPHEAPVAVVPPAPPPPRADPCADPGEVTLFFSPEHPVRGGPVRVVAVVDHEVPGQLSLADGDAGPGPSSVERHGGPPYFWFVAMDSAPLRKLTATFSRDASCNAAPKTKELKVGPTAPPPPPAPTDGSLWAAHSSWSSSMENLYSAWIEKLFDAPVGEQPTWPELDKVLRDPARNFLFDHLGPDDSLGMTVRPDCADLPYFLRAYFANKLALPFGWSHCTRGEGGGAPRCDAFGTNREPSPVIDGGPPPWPVPRPKDDDPNARARLFGDFLHTTLADSAQSGAARTAADDDESDYYPVKLSTETLRPGTIYADPYGHVLVVAKRIAQTPDAAGILFAVDGQPDGTVGRKRFWQGNFLFAIDPSLGSAGFKRFRPLVRDGTSQASPGRGPHQAGRTYRRKKNAELPDFGLDQYAAGVEGFYDAVSDLLSPSPLDPTRALLETMQALEEQVDTRVLSVDNGRRFLETDKPAAEMPEGAKIFETTGSWEDFSTPSRDLRMLIAIDIVGAFPAHVAKRPSMYRMPANRSTADLEHDLELTVAKELSTRKLSYTRSDGSKWELRLQDVMDRAVALEMAYDPNDCVELRWGAKEGTDEASTCVKHAPPEQHARMTEYRSWFHERRRPPR